MRVLYDSSMMNPCNNTLNTKVTDREVLLKLSGLRESGWGTHPSFLKTEDSYTCTSISEANEPFSFVEVQLTLTAKIHTDG